MLNIMLSVLCLAALKSGAAPDRVITSQGLELRNDERVFALFAALNALGYDDETEYTEPPIHAPVFGPLRASLRATLASSLDETARANLRTLFAHHPVPIETYLEALLIPDLSGTLRSDLSTLDEFASQAHLSQFLDRDCEKAHAYLLELQQHLDRDLALAQKRLNHFSLRVPAGLTIVPNLLEGHTLVRRVSGEGQVFLLPGPDLKASEVTILSEILNANLVPSAQALWSTRSGQKYAQSFAPDALHLARTIAQVVASTVVYGGQDNMESLLNKLPPN